MDKTEAQCRRPVEINLDDPQAYTDMRRLLVERGQLDAAEAPYRQAIDLEPAYARAHNNLGVLLANLGWLAEAESAFRQATERDPDDAAALTNLGSVLYSLGRAGEAVAPIQQGLRLRAGRVVGSPTWSTGNPSAGQPCTSPLKPSSEAHARIIPASACAAPR